MSSHTLTLNVPDMVFARLGERALKSNRTIEAEAISILAVSVSSEDELPPDLQAAVAALDLFDETELRRAFESRLSLEEAAELESLHFKVRREGLTLAEDQRRGDLMRQYERAMLVRARAAALLHQRGCNVTAML